MGPECLGEAGLQKSKWSRQLCYQEAELMQALSGDAELGLMRASQRLQTQVDGNFQLLQKQRQAFSETLPDPH